MFLSFSNNSANWLHDGSSSSVRKPNSILNESSPKVFEVKHKLVPNTDLSGMIVNYIERAQAYVL